MHTALVSSCVYRVNENDWVRSLKYFHKEGKLTIGRPDIIREKVLKTRDVKDFRNTDITLTVAC